MTHQGAAPAVGDDGKRHAHVALVDIVVVEGLPIPRQHLFVLLVERIEGRLEKPHEAGDASDILGRAAPLAGDERRIVDVGFPISNVLDEDVVAPVIASLRRSTNARYATESILTTSLASTSERGNSIITH